MMGPTAPDRLVAMVRVSRRVRVVMGMIPETPSAHRDHVMTMMSAIM